ncbi:hypothetical protein QQ045_006879 [Rhodiola kirilowii]
MGPTPAHRRSVPDELPVATTSSPPSAKRKWTHLMPICVALVVIAEVGFLFRLDVAEKAKVLSSWTESVNPFGLKDAGGGGVSGVVGKTDSCEEWLEREDAVEYTRDFWKDPVWVSGGEQEWKTCAVGCKFGFDAEKKPDAAFGLGREGGASVLRSMESASYYGENEISHARRKGYDIVMTTSLSSDVPVGYFSWAEYDIMAPVQPKTESALAAAFISNCAARNFRLEALEALEKSKIKIDSYGGCHRNRDGKVDKVETLKRYKFSLAFENSIEEDYVTEKFFQSLVAGSVPVVVGAPNIQEFAPAPGSILHIKEIKDVATVAERMKYLAVNPEAYNQTLRWKYEGPSDSFKALVDMAAVHSSCRLCIHLATQIREKEEKGPKYAKRPCKCTNGSETINHLYVRERGGFEMQSIFLRSRNITLDALHSAVLEKFKSKKHIPNWKDERPKQLRGADDDYEVYRIYPLGLTQRQALYTFHFTDAELEAHIQSNPCAKFEVIFV